MKRTDFLKHCLGGSALITLSCSDERNAENRSAHSRNKREDLYFEISALGANSYFFDHKEGLRLAGEHFGVRTEYKGPPDLNIQAMIQALELAVARRPGGVMVVGFEESLNDSVNKAVDAGIPVVTLDSDLPNSRRVAFVGTGNYDAGFRGGTKLAELVGGRGRVAILTKVGQPNLEERVRGYRDALAEYRGVELVRIADTKSEVPMAAQAAAATLAAVPELAGIGCVEAAGGAGAATAVREAGQAGKVKIVAMGQRHPELYPGRNHRRFGCTANHAYALVRPHDSLSTEPLRYSHFERQPGRGRFSRSPGYRYGDHSGGQVLLPGVHEIKRRGHKTEIRERPSEPVMCVSVRKRVIGRYSCLFPVRLCAFALYLRENSPSPPRGVYACSVAFFHGAG